MNIAEISIRKVLSTKNGDRFLPEDIGTPTEALMQSIQKSGISEPLWVQRKGKRCYLIHGFKRYRVAKKIGLKKIPVLVFQSSNVPDLLRQRLAANMATRVVTLFEKLDHIKKLGKLGRTAEELIQTDLPLMDFPAHKETYSLLTNLLELNSFLLGYLSSKNPPLKRLDYFCRLDKNTESHLTRLVRRFRPGFNDLESIAKYCAELARRESPQSVRSYFSKILSEARSNPGGDRQQAIQKILSLLHEKRYPVLSQKQKTIRRLIGQLPSTEQIAVHWDSRLEQPGLQLTFRVNKAEEFQRLADFFKNPKATTWIKKIIESLDFS